MTFLPPGNVPKPKSTRKLKEVEGGPTGCAQPHHKLPLFHFHLPPPPPPPPLARVVPHAPRPSLFGSSTHPDQPKKLQPKQRKSHGLLPRVKSFDPTAVSFSDPSPIARFDATSVPLASAESRLGPWFFLGRGALLGM
jgi:hypothetical protein